MPTPVPTPQGESSADKDECEIGDLAVWSLSTAKPGNGVEQLRDDDVNTYWQCVLHAARAARARRPGDAAATANPRRSDGPQPHLVNIQFHRKMVIHHIRVYTDFKLDESYTPAKISIRSGTTFHDLQEIHVQELHEPSGWHTILPTIEQAAGGGEGGGGPLRTHFIQVAVLANHQNGRDTHIRQIKIYTPRRLMGRHMDLPHFSSVRAPARRPPPARPPARPRLLRRSPPPAGEGAARRESRRPPPVRIHLAHSGQCAPLPTAGCLPAV